jgi:hypothetical protein
MMAKTLIGSSQLSVRTYAKNSSIRDITLENQYPESGSPLA